MNEIPATGQAQRVLRVLVVDDQAIVLQAMRNLLEVDGHRVSTCGSGLAATELFDEALREGSPFDAVVTDFGMPGLDGGAVARHVKLARPRTWVVMLTGWGPAVEASDGWKVHVDTFLGKPPRLAELRKVLAGAQGAA